MRPNEDELSAHHRATASEGVSYWRASAPAGAEMLAPTAYALVAVRRTHEGDYVASAEGGVAVVGASPFSLWETWHPLPWSDSWDVPPAGVAPARGGIAVAGRPELLGAR